MTLRTPRRRISLQTKRRYKAIKEFFRRALGSTSQSELLQIASSIAVNVTDINHKIVGLERRLSEVSKQCRENNYDGSIRSESAQSELSRRDIPSETQLKETQTKTLFCPSENHSKKSDKNDRKPVNYETNDVQLTNKTKNFSGDQIKKLKNKTTERENKVYCDDDDMDTNYHNQKTKSKSTHKSFVSAYSTSSFHSVDEFREMSHSNLGHSGHREKKSRTIVQNEHKEKTIREDSKKFNPESYDHHYEEETEKITKNRKSKRNPGLDQDFIADIIRRQYKPVKVFGKKQSDLSLFSAPVCRDREFSVSTDYRIPENFQPFVCNCGGRHRYAHHGDYSDVRSVRNAEIYNEQRKTRKKHSRKHIDVYNDSNIYDLVPVKEKTSPKSRRKFFEDHMSSPFYKEVPPSPRSHRPRLNLKALYSESDYRFVKNPSKRISPNRTIGHHFSEKYEENSCLASGEIEEMGQHISNNRSFQTHARREIGTISSLHPVLDTEENATAIETPLNKTEDTVFSDKTDKALGEIKDILQNFLLEIKKEGSSHSCKSQINTRNTGSDGPPNDVKSVPINGASFSHYNSVQCPVIPAPYIPTIPTFGTNCCYPMMPVCPMNYMQNSCAVPSPSFTCNNCVDKSNDTNYGKDTSRNDAASEPFQSGTDELIKKIYNFVSQSPMKKIGDSNNEESNTRNHFTDGKELNSRSAGGTTGVCKYDAKVGTHERNCVRKSCEAMGQKISSEVYGNDTNASYTNSISENHSLEPTGTQSTLASEFSTELSVEEKTKKTRFAKVMEMLGLYKKNKKDVNEELSESESTIEDNVAAKKPPFQQDITSYAMYGQEFSRPPPMPSRNHPCHPRDYQPPYNPDVPSHHHSEYPQDYRPPYNPDVPHRDPRLQQPVGLRSPHPHYLTEKRPTAPPYFESYESYNQMQPQIPFCLKEVEVKSVACQSERKMSFFRKITQKAPRPPDMTRDQFQRNGETQTQTDQNKSGFFSWKSPKAKLMEQQKNSLAYSLNVQKKLMERDQKMKNAMVNKFFYKRNPFSRKNLILKTLLNQDKFSNGVPTYRPKLFF